MELHAPSWFKINTNKRNHRERIVDSHNTKTGKVVTHEIVGSEADQENVRVLQLDLIAANDLAIADDQNTGGDPYNSTGQHVIITSRTNLED